MVDPEGAQANDPAVGPALQSATGICVTGGDQKRLVNEVRHTRTQHTLVDCLREGTPVFTTSAGTVALSDPMVAGLDDDDRMCIGPGLGILPGVVLETHVDTRRRHHRLFELRDRAVAPLVLGLDENTALLFEPRSSEALVLGVGQLTVLSCEGPARDGVVLPSGSRFNVLDFVPG